MSTRAPIEPKVYAGTIGAAAGVAVTNLLLWLVGVVLFGGPSDAPRNAEAIAAVPDAVGTALKLVATAGMAFLGGYLARHAVRPPGAGAEPVEDETAEGWPPDVQHAEHPLSPAAQAAHTNDQDGDGHDDKTGQFV